MSILNELQGVLSESEKQILWRLQHEARESQIQWYTAQCEGRDIGSDPGWKVNDSSSVKAVQSVSVYNPNLDEFIACQAGAV